MKKKHNKPAFFHPVVTVTTIAAFDFDGTITTKDTMTDYIRFVKGDFAYYSGLLILSPMLFGYLLKLIPRQKAKEKLLSYFFKGDSESQLYEWGKDYTEKLLPERIRLKAKEVIEWHKENGHALYLVTASLSFWTRAWAEKNGFTLIASEPEIKEGVFTGKIKGKNCYGQQKVNRLTILLNESETYRCFAYGDSGGDRELLSWADVPFYRALE
ncbi:MAG: HAD-IB family hydrolase [Bacteroidia bacterium]|nr:HAD-IB family hydrolase [Bacteroidia bacterium]